MIDSEKYSFFCRVNMKSIVNSNGQTVLNATNMSHITETATTVEVTAYQVLSVSFHPPGNNEILSQGKQLLCLQNFQIDQYCEESSILFIKITNTGGSGLVCLRNHGWTEKESTFSATVMPIKFSNWCNLLHFIRNASSAPPHRKQQTQAAVMRNRRRGDHWWWYPMWLE